MKNSASTNGCVLGARSMPSYDANPKGLGSSSPDVTFGSASNARSSVASPSGINGTNKGCGPGCGHQMAQPLFWSNKGNGARICTRSGFYSFGVTYFKTTPYTYWMYILHNEYCLKFSCFTMFHHVSPYRNRVLLSQWQNHCWKLRICEPPAKWPNFFTSNAMSRG